MATPRNKRKITAVIGILVVLAVGALYGRRLFRVEVRTVTATITRLDPSHATASIEVLHPRTGQPFEIEGAIPSTCDIRINGAPARLDELRVGDRAEVQGTIHWDRSITANWVRVTRAATVPASTPVNESPPQP